MKTNKSYVDGTGQRVSLGNEIKRGGEGTIYEVSSNPALVAKVYHQSISQEKQNKIRTMAVLKSDALLKISTWPLDVLRNGSNQIVGFLMPKLSGKEIHELYSPKTRLIQFPNVTFAFLVHAAANLARAFAAVHEQGHVVGDVNHGNFFITDKATVMLVDCDSFQIENGSNRFYCEVGVPMYQPPELQDVQSFRNIVRTSNHDNFGLAVFIFLTLFMGRHPFAGRYSGPGEMPIEKAIKEFRFAYSSSAAAMSMQPPPYTMPLNILPNPVTDLFERAFSKQGIKTRPSAQEWVMALSTLSGQLKRCSNKEGHVYSNHLSSCPWCSHEANTGIVLFHATITVHQVQHNSTFKIDVIWAQIQAVQSPGNPKGLPQISSYSAKPSPEIMEARKKRRIRKALSILPSIISIPILMFSPSAAVIVIIGVLIFTWAIYTSGTGEMKQELKKKQQESKQNWTHISNRWVKESGDEAFQRKRSELANAKNNYQGLAEKRKEKLKQLHSQQKSRQLYAYLQRFRIENAKIEGIGPSRKATLESFGIETAADIQASAIRLVPGFGPSYTRKLVDWRNNLERKFVFDPNKGIPKADIDALDRDISMEKKKLEQELLSGKPQLQQIANQISVRREALWREVERCATALGQVEVDLKTL